MPTTPRTPTLPRPTVSHPGFDAHAQAVKLLGFSRRGGDAARWWSSKGFTREQRAAVKSALADLEVRP